MWEVWLSQRAHNPLNRVRLPNVLPSSDRLVVRTGVFQASNRGSIPRQSTKALSSNGRTLDSQSSNQSSILCGATIRE